jgi:hypothetical protein
MKVTLSGGLEIDLSQPLPDRPRVVLVEAKDGRRAVLGDGLDPTEAEALMATTTGDKAVSDFRSQLENANLDLLGNLLNVFDAIRRREDHATIALAMIGELGRAVEGRGKRQPTRSVRKPKTPPTLEEALDDALGSVLAGKKGR